MCALLWTPPAQNPRSAPAIIVNGSKTALDKCKNMDLITYYAKLMLTALRNNQPLKLKPSLGSQPSESIPHLLDPSKVRVDPGQNHRADFKCIQAYPTLHIQCLCIDVVYKQMFVVFQTLLVSYELFLTKLNELNL